MALVLLLPVAAYVLFSLKVARQWEKVAVLRLGKYGNKGPGMFWIVPVVDSLSGLRRSTYPRDRRAGRIDPDARRVCRCTWTRLSSGWCGNAEKAVLEVESFFDAITMSAQNGITGIDRPPHADRDADRPRCVGHELQKILDAKTNPWGTPCKSVEIRDVQLPPGIGGCHVPAGASRAERQARIILGTPRPKSPRSSNQRRSGT